MSLDISYMGRIGSWNFGLRVRATIPSPVARALSLPRQPARSRETRLDAWFIPQNTPTKLSR